MHFLQFGYLRVCSYQRQMNAGPQVFSQRHSNAISISKLQLCDHVKNEQKALCIFLPHSKKPSRLLLPRLFRIAAHNLNLLRRDVVLIVQLEIDILDKERPDLVAKAVGIKMTLFC